MIECKIFSSYSGTGITCVTSTYRMFVINNVEDPRVRRLAEIPGNNIKKENLIVLNVNVAPSNQSIKLLFFSGSKLF